MNDLIALAKAAVQAAGYAGSNIMSDCYGRLNAEAKQKLAALIEAVTALEAENKRLKDEWEAFAQLAENMQNQAPYKHQPGWKYTCCAFARQVRAQAAQAEETQNG